MEKEIKIPVFLQELHGEKTTVSALWATYLSSVITTVTLYFLLVGPGFEVWQKVLFCILTADISAGVIANFTSPVKDYYAKRPKLKPLFLLLHVVHPLLLTLIFPGNFSFFIYPAVFTLMGSFILLAIKNADNQKYVASFLMVLGLLLIFILPTEDKNLEIIPVLYMIKLILGFSVSKTECTGT